MATSRSSAVLVGVLVLWVVFGSWSLFRTDAGDVPGLDPLAGHVVVFFFVSLAVVGLITRRLGAVRGVAAGAIVVGVASVVSELLQPILTDTRRFEQVDLAANGAGIVAAVVASAVLMAVVADPQRRGWIVSGVCVAGLVAAGGATALGTQQVRVALECRGIGLEPIPGVDGSPVIHVEGGEVVVGAGAGGSRRPLGDGLILGTSRDLRCNAMRAGEFTVVATVVPESARSNGPTRIFTSSTGTRFDQANAHLGQEFDQLSIRLRSGRSLEWWLVPDVFSAGQMVTVAFVVDGGDVVVYVDGVEREVFGLADASFVEWDPDFPVLIGDEFTRDRTFDGEILRVSVFDRALRSGDPLLG